MEDLFKPKFVNNPYRPEEVKPVTLEAINAYLDDSPVRILYGGIQSNIREKEETIVFEAVMNMGVDVDKEKLLHALAYDRMQYYEGFHAGQKAAQAKWISVEERLPEEDGQCVLCAVKDYWGVAVCEGYYSKASNRIWPNDEDCALDKVTHWMPMPTPPKEDNDERSNEDPDERTGTARI